MTTTEPRPTFDDRQASQLAGDAVAHAEALGVRVAAVVVDATGTILAARRQADSYLSTFNIALAKAFTALNFGVETHVMAERLGSVEYGTHIAQAEPRLLFVKGGCPLMVEGRVVGAIGVSGASADQDLECAREAADAWLAT